MKIFNYIKMTGAKTTATLLLLCLLSISSASYAANDTVVFRIKVLQDSVYAGHPVDVEFYIENQRPGLLNTVLNLLGQFEMEIATDTSRTVQANTTFDFDRPSLSTFFGTLFSNLQTSSTLNPVLGRLNMKVKSNKGGSGNARVGKSQYIVQDNAAGRQQMQFYFTKSIAKGLLGLNIPVKVITDSVFVIGEPTPIIRPQNISAFKTAKKEFSINIFPNPATDYIHLEGKEIKQYKLMSMDGNTILSAGNESLEAVQIDVSALATGFYVLLVQSNEDWNTYKIIKQ